MERLTWMLAGMLRHAAGWLPPGRQQWAEAVRAEAGQVPAGWPRLRWLAGGLWLVAREGATMMIGKVVYRLGAVAVAALAAWAVWLSWRASPAADPQTLTDRVRVLVGAAALVVLPWVGRRRGWFGPVRGSVTARLVRLAGCAAVCGLGTAVVRMDSHLGLGPHGPGPFSLSREIAAVVLAGAVPAARAVGKARWPDADPMALWVVPRLRVCSSSPRCRCRRSRSYTWLGSSPRHRGGPRQRTCPSPPARSPAWPRAWPWPWPFTRSTRRTIAMSAG